MVKGVRPHLVHVLQALLLAVIRVQHIALLPGASRWDVSQQAANLNAHHHEGGAIWVVHVLCKVEAHDVGLSRHCWVAPAGSQPSCSGHAAVAGKLCSPLTACGGSTRGGQQQTAHSRRGMCCRYVSVQPG